LNIEHSKRITISDITLGVLLVILMILSASVFYRKESDRAVFIYKNGIKFGEYPIIRDKVVVIDEHNTIQIRNGRVRMLKADCKDKRCVKQGYNDLLPIICLPNKLVVEIKRSEAEKKFLLY